MLAGIHEQLQVLNHNTAKVHGGKPAPIARWPRPIAAAQKIIERKGRETHERIVKTLLADR